MSIPLTDPEADMTLKLTLTDPEADKKSQIALLAAIHSIFEETQTTRISSKQLVESLRALPCGHYSAFRTLYSALAWLSRSLRPFGISSRLMRIGTTTAKGYDLADFTETFSRLLES